MSVDVLFVCPSSSLKAYQALSAKYSAVEPPTWALLLAEAMRSFEFVPAILDINAEKLSVAESVDRIQVVNPRLVCLVVYGQNPNSGTVNMVGAVEVAEAIKSRGIGLPISIVGSHVSALPLEVLNNEHAIDIVFCNEGVYSLKNLLGSDLSRNDSISKVKGIGYRKGGEAVLTEPQKVVPQKDIDSHLPGYAWDLLPYDEKPLDLYRSHFWHAEYNHDNRTPFAAIYTSLGCTFRCSFCMINMLNRDDNVEIGVASNYATMRFWSPEHVFQQIRDLYDIGVRTLRFSDEMFLLNRKYFVPLCKMLRDSGFGKELNIWAYSRVDTIRDIETLKLLRNAGIRWLALGIESGERKVRLEVTKGKYEDVDIHNVINMVESAGIQVIANYLFGLPGDNYASMQKTLDLSLELCTTAWNGYPVIPLPGSSIYADAIKRQYKIPSHYSGYSFLGYDTLPLPTADLSPEEILEFRDKAYTKYHTYKPFLDKVENRFGSVARENIERMARVQLKRNILESRS